MACVVVWRLTRTAGPEAQELRGVLIRLSGRQMKWGKRFTEPTLLAGLRVLLSMLNLLEQISLDELRVLARSFLPFNDSG